MTTMTRDLRFATRRRAKAMIAASLLACTLAAHAQPVPPPAAPAVAPRTTAPAAELLNIADLGWLEGCWAGTVNQRDFREQWSPVRGSMLLGAGSSVFQGKTQSYEYLRIESRPDGIFYVALPSGQGETVFKLSAIDTDDKDTIYVFANPATGYKFDKWTGNCTGTTSCSLTMTANRAVTAYFVPVNHNLSIAVDPAVGGTTTPAVGTYPYPEGSVVNVTATPLDGYEFAECDLKMRHFLWCVFFAHFRQPNVAH